MAEQVYRPSQAVPVSGVYRVEHDAHRDAHEATLLEGESFPNCAVCGERVRFVLKHRANGITGDKGLLPVK
jgi:hypothetical protein